MIRMNYEVVPLKGPSQYELNGVRFRGKNFMYWKNRSSRSVMGVTVVFSRDQENVPVSDGVIILSLKGLTNYNDLKEAILIFQQVVSNQKLRFQFVVGNEEEKKVAEALGRDFSLFYEIRETWKQKDETIDAVRKNLESTDSSELSADGSKTITTDQNGISKKVTISDGKAYVNSGLLSINEEKKILLEKWMKDPALNHEIRGLSAEALDQKLSNAVNANRTAYRMESAREQSAHNKVGDIAMKKASQEDGLVNANLGIVQNHVSNVNQYSAVEQQGENVQVVNPTVSSSSIRSNGVIDSGGTSLEHLENVEGATEDLSKAQEQGEQQRQVDTIIYMDENENLFDSSYNWIGELNKDGYHCKNNMILNGNEEVVGIVKSLEDTNSKSNSNIYSNPKVRTLKKPERPIDTSNKQAAFVSLPVIIFILSTLLLIASFVLLFLVD